MEKRFKKYMNDVISPADFDQLADYFIQKGNSPAVSEMINPEWKRFLHDPDISRENPQLLQEIQRLINLEERTRIKKKLRLYAYGLRIAAVLLVGLLISGIWLFPNATPDQTSFQTQTVSVPYGARTQFALPDGSVVWLNSGSSLSYSFDFSKQRHVELKGEGFFDVVKSKTTFMVSTIYGKINVLGTAFNVQADPDDHFAVTLERGSIRLQDPEGGKDQLLSPGEQLRFENGTYIKRTVETALFTSWKDGKLIFNREPFPVMMDRLERWYNVEIAYSAGDFKELWFTGTIRDETLTEVMEMVCKAAPVNYSYNSRERLIKITARNE